jgi:hypothetical protein
MKTARTKRISGIAWLPLLMPGLCSAATVYNFTPITQAGTNVYIYNGAAINDSGTVAWIASSSQVDAFNGSTVTDYLIPAASWLGLSNAAAISFYDYAADEGAIYSTSSGTTTLFQYPGAQYTLSSGSSADGTVAGYYTDTSYNQFGFTYNGSAFTQVTYPGPHGQIYVMDVNDAGNVVGISSCCDSGVGFVDENGVYTTITYPGLPNGDVIPQGINDSNTVVGWAYNPTAQAEHGFVWQNGITTTVNYPGAADTILYGINSSGEIVGEAQLPNGQGILFTAQVSPAPEPASMLLVGLSLVGAGCIRRRAR